MNRRFKLQIGNRILSATRMPLPVAEGYLQNSLYFKCNPKQVVKLPKEYRTDNLVLMLKTGKVEEVRKLAENLIKVALQ